MLICFSYCHRDDDLALKNAQWIAELGGCKGHTCLAVRDHRANPDATEALRPSFDSLEEIVFTYDTFNHWPESANKQFQFAATHVEWMLKAPYWLFMEADAIPVQAGWADALQAEYEAARKPFMGDRVAVTGIPVHMSGNGIYPGRMTQYAGEAMVALEVAWDVQASHRIVPNMHDTKLIEHSWEGEKKRTFESLEQVKREIAPETVLFHSSKDGSLIDILRRGREVAKLTAGISPREMPIGAVEVPSTANAGSNPAPYGSCDIFIKTYPPDYEWLEYCLRSIERFAIGFGKTVISYSEPDVNKTHPVSPMFPFDFLKGCKVVNVGDQPDGYLWQQVIKLDADKYTDADYILYLDSDTILAKPVTPQTFFENGKIVWMMTPWAKTSTPWQPIIEKFLKRPVAFEFMRRAPQMVPRWLLSDLRSFCEIEHGMSMDAYVMSQPDRGFSEFNALGAFAFEFRQEKFHWIDTVRIPEKDWPELVVDQRWSRGGLTPEIKAEWDKILSVPVLAENAGSKPLSGRESGGSLEARESNNHQSKRVLAESHGSSLDSSGAQKPLDGTEQGTPEKRHTSTCPDTAPPVPSNTLPVLDPTHDHIGAVKRLFTSPLAKARIMRSLKFAPIIK